MGIPLLPHVCIPVGLPLFTQLYRKLILRFTIYSFNTILQFFFKKLQVRGKTKFQQARREMHCSGGAAVEERRAVERNLEKTEDRDIPDE